MSSGENDEVVTVGQNLGPGGRAWRNENPSTIAKPQYKPTAPCSACGEAPEDCTGCCMACEQSEGRTHEQVNRPGESA